MAKASADINKRKALKPMLQWLKTAIFDHILQDIGGQDDMQFTWIGMEDSGDEETMANNFKTLIGAGIMSIDEARVQLGMNPWGLPLTSDPVYMSATGVSTLGVIAPGIADADLGYPLISPEQAASQPTTPQQVQLPSQLPEGQDQTPTVVQPANAAGTPGIGGRPQGGGGGAPAIVAPASGSSTPLHGSGKKKQTKALEIAAFGELDSIRRALKKGRQIDKWETKFISKNVLEKVQKTFEQKKDASAAVTIGKKAFKAEQRVQQRRDTVAHISSHVANTLGTLAANIDNPHVGMIGFIDQGTRVLQQGYHATYNAAARDAASDFPSVSPVTNHDFLNLAIARAEQQRGYLTGFAQDIKSGISQPKINARLNLYSRSLTPVYEQGYGLAVLAGGAPTDSTSQTDANYPIDDTSDSIDDYTALDDMYSGDGTDITDGTDNGMSALDALAGLVGAGIAIGSLIGADQTDGDGVMLSDESDLPDTATGNDTIIWHTNSADPCDLCADRDGEEYTIDTLPCWPGDGGFGEYCEGAANCQCTLEYVQGDGSSTTEDNPFSDMSNDFYQQRLDEEVSLDQAAADARAADIASVALDSPDAAARMQANDALYGTPYTRDSYFASADVALTKAESESIGDIVVHYLKQHYKKSAVKWAKNATWTFDPDMSVDDLILMRPQADISQSHVAEIKQDVQKGSSLHPIVVVKTSNGYEVADGNHRVTALRQLGIKTTTAYIGSGVGDFGPWTSMMQDDSLKKSLAKKNNEDLIATVYKALDPEVLSILSVGDIIFDDAAISFSSSRPDAEVVAVVKYLPSGRILPGQELLVTDITDNEVTLEIL